MLHMYNIGPHYKDKEESTLVVARFLIRQLLSCVSLFLTIYAQKFQYFISTIVLWQHSMMAMHSSEPVSQATHPCIHPCTYNMYVTMR